MSKTETTLFSGPSSATKEECTTNDLDRAITMANHDRDILESRAGNNSRLPWRRCQGSEGGIW